MKSEKKIRINTVQVRIYFVIPEHMGGHIANAKKTSIIVKLRTNTPYEHELGAHNREAQLGAFIENMRVLAMNAKRSNPELETSTKQTLKSLIRSTKYV